MAATTTSGRFAALRAYFEAAVDSALASGDVASVAESFPTLDEADRQLVVDLLAQVKQGIRANSEAEFADVCAEHGAEVALTALDAKCAERGVHMVGRLPLATTATGMAGPGDAARAERVAAMRKEKEVLAKMLAEAEESEASLDGRLACGAAAYHDLLAKLGQSIESMQTLHSATKEWGQRSAKLWQAAA